jgi:hypothetical protein
LNAFLAEITVILHNARNNNSLEKLNRKDVRYAVHFSSRSDCALAVGNDFVIHNQRFYPYSARHRHYRDSCAYYQGQKSTLTATNPKGVLHMNTIVSIALLVVGILLIILGVSASESFSSDVSRFFTGSPTNRTVWLLIVGIVLVSSGLFGTFRGTKGN